MKLYLSSTAGPSGYVDTKKSSALPVGTQATASSSGRLTLTTGRTGTQAQRTATASAVQQDDDLYFGKWISAPLRATEIVANTWTFGFAWTESNTSLDLFTALSVYILTSGDTVRGFIYDSHVSLGTEPGTSEVGKVGTFSGAAVNSVVPGSDRLAVEVWAHTQKTMSVAYTGTFSYAGATDPVDGTLTSDAASYISTPQELFVPRASATTFQSPALLARALRRERERLWLPRLWLPTPVGVPA